MELGVLFTTNEVEQDVLSIHLCILFQMHTFTIEVISLHITTNKIIGRLPKNSYKFIYVFSPFISQVVWASLFRHLPNVTLHLVAMIANFIIYQLFVDKDNENKVQYKIIPLFFIDSNLIWFWMARSPYAELFYKNILK